MRLGKHIEKNTDNYSIGSKEKLKASMRHKIKKTFVGCLDALELEIGKTDPELFNRLRKKVLSLGNDQIRNMETELEKYNIEFIAYHIEFEVKPLDGVDDANLRRS